MPFWRTVTVSFGCHTTHIVNIESTAFECSVNTFRSQPRWLALVRFRLQYLGWRSTSLGLGELTPGSCGNAFGVKNRTANLIRIVSPERPRPGWPCHGLALNSPISPSPCLPISASPHLRVSPSPRLPISASPHLRVSPSPRLPISVSPHLPPPQFY